MVPVEFEGKKPGKSDEDEVPLQNNHHWIIVILFIFYAQDSIDHAVQHHNDQVESKGGLTQEAAPGNSRGIPEVHIPHYQCDDHSQQEKDDEKEDRAYVVDDGIAVSIDSADGG